MSTCLEPTRVTLPDGGQVLVRQVRPTDADALAEGFQGLTSESRRLRFLGTKMHLTKQELRYLTHVDHHHHEALAAVNETDGRALGVARYVRDIHAPQRAEIAVTVVDAWQGRGLGTALLTALLDRAREEGITSFTALVSVDNAAMIKVLMRLGRLQVLTSEGGAFEYLLTPRVQAPEGREGPEGVVVDLVVSCEQDELLRPTA